MIKKILKKAKALNRDSSGVNNALRLMFEIAVSDGKLDKTEIEIIKNHAEEIETVSRSVNSIIKDILKESEHSTSLYPTVQKINDEYTYDEKIQLLKTLWQIIIADGMIDYHEENLYFKIAELIKIKRSIANKIKQQTT
jgi:uncharacterized tellurite resistance protein B-like protein